MRKTSVYLTEEEAEGLRRAAAATGRSQAELIRDGVRHVIAACGLRRRQFHSLGKGRSGGSPYSGWTSDTLYKEAMGQE
jgi:hypothetical protein